MAMGRPISCSIAPRPSAGVGTWRTTRRIWSSTPPPRAQAESLGDKPFSSEIKLRAIGFNPFSGALLRTDDAHVVPYSKCDGQKLMRGDLQGRANGTVVRLRHNARRGTLSFNIDGEAWVEVTQTRMPALVRPWVHLFKGDDKVTITASTQRQSAGPRPTLWLR